MSRYNRHIILEEVGPKGQARLNAAKVLVIGAGGLGCPALQYLTAAGIGTLGIIDFDVIALSNLQRQILFGTSQLGRNKALAAKERLQDLNPDIQINAYPYRLTATNGLSLFESYDLIVDGSDNFATRYLVNDLSVLANRPVIFGAIYKFEGQVSVFNYMNGPSYRCLFPKQPKEGSVPNCSDVGVLGVLPGIIGSMQANEVIKIILGFDNILSGKLLFYNAKTSTSSQITITKSATQFEKVRSYKDTLASVHPSIAKAILGVEISAEEALALSDVQFIDVRDKEEIPEIEVLRSQRIPLPALKENLDKFKPDQMYIVFCQTGVRSRQAVQLLKQSNIPNCFSLIGGATAIVGQLKIKS